MARGDDSGKSLPVPPKRNPFRQEILTQEEAAAVVENREPVAPLKQYRHQHSLGDLELLQNDLARQIFPVAEEGFHRADEASTSQSEWINVFEKELEGAGFLTPGAREYLRDFYQTPESEAKELSDVCHALAGEIAQEIMAYSEACELAYGEAHREMLESLRDAEKAEKTKDLLKNYLPLVFQED